MSVLKSISGHTGLARCKDYLLLGKGEVRQYFEGKGKDRCLAKDFLNLSPRESAVWDEVMDDTRRRHRNDRNWGKGKCRTYNHFIISPDPKDGIDLDTLRELAMRWCEEHFGFDGDVGPAECAIMYHDDNSERAGKGLPGIPHAHIIVNNTNLETGSRIHLSKQQNRNLATSLSRISKELGLSYFSVDKFVHDGKTVYERTHHIPSKEKPGTYDHRPSAQEQYHTMTERKLEQRGERSWKDELRESIEIACNMASDMPELRRVLGEMGVVTEERTSARAIPGDLLFYYPNPDVPPEQNKRKVSGQRLGRRFTPDGLADQMKLAYYRKLAREDRDEARILSLVSDINTVRTDPSAKVELQDISRAFAAITEYRIQNIEDAKSTLSHVNSILKMDGLAGAERENFEDRRENLKALLRIADKTNILPENERMQKSLPHDYKQVREQRREQAKRTVTLEEKVDRGWRLTKTEYKTLKEKRPTDFLRWRRNRMMAKEGYDPSTAEATSRSSSPPTEEQVSSRQMPQPPAINR